MAEIRVNATGGLKLYDADDSHYAQIVAGTITSNVDAITLGHDTVTIADNLSLGSDSAVLKFGADGDTTLTHTDGTGLTLNSTNKLCFNDASQFIQGSSGTVLSIGATDEIDLTATAVDLNGTLNVSGVATFQSTPVFPDGSLPLADLDIDGGTDIGAALVDADEIIVDDGGGGTNRRCDMSRVKTYVGGDSTPLFSAYHNTTQVISNDSATQVAFNTESNATQGAAGIDSDTKFASNVFTPTVAGYYFVKFGTTFAVTDTVAINIYIRRNSANAYRVETRSSASGADKNGFQTSVILYLDSDDTCDVTIYVTNDDVTLNGLSSNTVYTYFQGWRLTGV